MSLPANQDGTVFLETPAEPVAPGPTLLRWARGVPFVFWLMIVAGTLIGRPPTAPIELETLASAWHMWLAGSWIPLQGGIGAGNQPPLQLWAILAGWQVFGVSDLWPRVLSVLASLATLVIIGRSAALLWPHRDTAGLYARILVIGVIAFALISTMVQPEPLALCWAAFGFHALGRLWQRRGAALAAWAGFALAVLLQLFTIGNSAWLMLPLVALLAPRLPIAAGDGLDVTEKPKAPTARIMLKLVPAWHLPLAAALTPALILWTGWLFHLRGNGVDAGFVGFGNGWINDATEASRREAWSLFLLPVMLYPWICWKTLWRALARQLQGRLGHSFRLCLLFLGATIIAGLGGGWQMQGMIFIILPLSLLGARLLATQEIRAKDFHAIVPSLLALLLGLFFFLMNIVPTAHLDALWRQLFDVSLPIWIGGIGMTSGLVLLVAGYAIAQLSPMQLLSRTIQVASLPVLLMTCINIEFPFNLRQFFDLKPVAARLRELEGAGLPLAVYGRYRGEFDFYGRLAQAPVALPDLAAALGWAAANPAGVVVSYFDGSPLRLPALPYYRGVARDRWVAVWPASAVLATGGGALGPGF